jgi:hypothetical protein
MELFEAQPFRYGSRGGVCAPGRSSRRRNICFMRRSPKIPFLHFNLVLVAIGNTCLPDNQHPTIASEMKVSAIQGGDAVQTVAHQLCNDTSNNPFGSLAYLLTCVYSITDAVNARPKESRRVPMRLQPYCLLKTLKCCRLTSLLRRSVYCLSHTARS